MARACSAVTQRLDFGAKMTPMRLAWARQATSASSQQVGTTSADEGGGGRASRTLRKAVRAMSASTLRVGGAEKE